MPVVSAVAVGLALGLDTAFGEFPARVHPVALLGRVIEPLDRSWPAPRFVGFAIAVVLPLASAGTAWALVALAARTSPVTGAVVAGVALFGATSLRMLASVAGDVIDRTETDLDDARRRVRALVGRDATTLTAPEIRSAVVESTAENLADGLVGPLLAFALGAQVSLALGVAAAVGVKTVNTLDSMLGYHSKPVGWASARLDDALMWIPARVSALLVALATLDVRALARARAWAQTPPSPNSGWPMATLAAALDVRLTKPGAYVLNPNAALPTVSDARRGVRVVRIAGVLAFLGAGVATW